MSNVDFVTNVFERTYRKLLQPGRILAHAEQHCFPFARRIVLVNNVNDRRNAELHLNPLLATGEITDAFFVADRLDDVLKTVGLTRSRIAPTIHYTDCSLTAILLPGSPYLLYNDADVLLVEKQDWVSPSLRLMQQDSRVAVANPDWTPSTLQQEAREYVGAFTLGYGFSDQLYLLHREEFAKPIYRYHALISWRYPLSYIAPVFEQSVDAYMRVHHRLRATWTSTRYEHCDEEGAAYRKTKLLPRWKRRLMQQAVKFGQMLPGNDPRFHL